MKPEEAPRYAVNLGVKLGATDVVAKLVDSNKTMLRFAKNEITVTSPATFPFNSHKEALRTEWGIRKSANHYSKIYILYIRLVKTIKKLLAKRKTAKSP